MSEFRLGDVIDDFCVKCRRLTNHAIVSLLDGMPAKVRCRTCYHDHDYRHEQPPPKKETKKEALFKEVLSSVDPAAAAKEEPPVAVKEEPPVAVKEEPPAAIKEESPAAVKEESPAAVAEAPPKKAKRAKKS